MKDSRFISEFKINIKNITPLKIGNGKEEMDILIDKNTNKPLILGSSIAGAMKNYLVDLGEEDKVNSVFGSENNNGNDSKIYISDSFGDDFNIGARPGIRRDYKYGTTLDKGKYETAFVESNASFEIKIKAFAKNKEEIEIEKELIDKCIEGLNSRNLRLGANKMNGFGSFKVNKVETIDFDLNNKEDIKNYILDNKKFNIQDLNKYNEDTNKGYIEISFKGSIIDSLIVKQDFEPEDTKQDLKSKDIDCENMKNINKDNIIPGSTIKGLVREYSTNILNTLNKDKEIIEKIFGNSPENKTNHTIGRVLAQDCIIKNPRYCVYNRIKVDRFTGGVVTAGKFNEKRVQGDIDINLSLRKFDCDTQYKNDVAVGMILMTLRDLGLGKISIGSSSSVGSGRFLGKQITIKDNDQIINIDFKDGDVKSDNDAYIENVINEIVRIKGEK